MNTYTAFGGNQLIATGSVETVLPALKAWTDGNEEGPSALVFEDQTGQQIDFDLRGTDAEALARLAEHPWFRDRDAAADKRQGPGRPKLGVVSREVSLLPRHWDWLGEQRGGASATLRAMVETSMKAGQGAERARKARDAASKVMWAIAGNLPLFEDASRALSRHEWQRFHDLTEAWPKDLRDHLRKLVAVAADAEKEAGPGV